MKYHIRIEGGFTGIPRILEGEMKLDPEEAHNLFEALEHPDTPDETAWPDALHYKIRLLDGSRTKEAEYAEHKLPVLIRNFVDDVRLK